MGCERIDRDGAETATISVREIVATQPHAIEVQGLSAPELAPNDTAWRRIVTVYVENSGTDSAQPAVIGRYVADDDRVRFEPRFPFAEGVAYRVEVDTSTPSASAPKLIHRFVIPSADRPRTTRIVAVHPSSARLPENLLRLYVETTAPMEVGSALANIHLLDESGREVEGPFLALDEELWDPARTRLTLLLDPGRVKRGVRTNVESGAPLVAGRRYRLVIDDRWKDGSGAALASGFEMAFEAVSADRQSPDPTAWRLTPPSAGSRSALHVAFGEPLDHALASRLIDVLDSRGTPVAGSVALAANDSAWVFTPASPWKAGEFTLRVGGPLEDIAGNNVARVFDVDRTRDSAGVDRDVGGSTRSVRFRIL
jgi:hypothetical protein